MTVKVVCTILSSPETSLHWTAPHLTLIHDFSNIRLSRPGGCIDHSGSLAERRRRSPHDQAGSGIRTRNLTITKPMINQLSYLAVNMLDMKLFSELWRIFCCPRKCVNDLLPFLCACQLVMNINMVCKAKKSHFSQGASEGVLMFITHK